MVCSSQRFVPYPVSFSKPPGTPRCKPRFSTHTRYDDGGRRYVVYRGRIDHRQVAVIWRETEGWKKADLVRDKKFVAKRKLAEGADEVFVNGDSFIPNAKALEPVFKARMFAPVEV